MDIKGYKRLSRSMFFIGAMIVCFGLGLYQLMDTVTVGVALIIIGAATLVMSFTFTRFFVLYDMSNKPRRRNE